MHGMMDIFTVCFFGHREIDYFNLAEEKVYEIVGNLIRSKEYVDFLVGRNGEFDQIVSSCVIRAKKNVFDANSSLVLILPYPTADYLNNEKYYEDYYDSIEIVNDSDTHFKAAFQKRNREMVDRADFCVFYVDHNSGGAYQTMKYAKAQGKPIINIAKLDEQLKAASFIADGFYCRFCSTTCSQTQYSLSNRLDNLTLLWYHR